LTALIALIRLGLLLVSLAILAGFLGFLHPAFDTLGQFRFHLSAVLLVFAAAFLFAARIRPVAGVALVVALAGVAGAWSGLPLPQTWASNSASGGTRYTMLQLNLRFDNARPERFLSMIERHEPDLILVQEVSDIWEPRLAGLADIFPYIFRCPEWLEEGGTAILSRMPIRAGSGHCEDYSRFASVLMEFGDTPVIVGNVHLRWPWPASGPRQVAAMSGTLAAIGEDALVAGDFNSATWSHSVWQFASHGGLAIQPGIGPTWLDRRLPETLRRYLGFPIDNVLSKGKVSIVSSRRLEDAGSDHLPVLTVFEIDDTDCCLPAN
jgi:endonuclease/exonuclease/phosphatase (EEP) superfamily protein YafD